MTEESKTMYCHGYEHDACGMGFITQIDGKPSHELIERALVMLSRMNHRGGTGSEPDTGDGAGILFAMPDKFFQKYAEEQEFTLPSLGDYAVGMFFLPQKEQEKNAMLGSVTAEITASGFKVLATRNVPYIYENCGPTAQKAMPGFEQVIIQRPADTEAGRPFEDRSKAA